jgi:hypothetical protein
LIIHQGDRLIIDGPKKLNEVAIAEIDNDYNYNFEYIERSDDKNKIYAGIFAFKNYNLLIQSLVKENEIFNKTLLRYAILEGISFYNRYIFFPYFFCISLTWFKVFRDSDKNFMVFVFFI